MKHAILAAEDERFYQHGGVDYLSVAARRAGQRRVRHPAGRRHDHHAGRPQLLPDPGEDGHPQAARGAAGLEDRGQPDQGRDPRALHQPDLPRPARLRLRRRRPDLLRQAAEGRHASPRRPCSRGCPRRPRPTTRSPIRAAPRPASSTCCGGCTSFSSSPTTSSRKHRTRRWRSARASATCVPTHAEYVAEMARQVVFDAYGEERLHAGHHRLDDDPQGRPGGGLRGGAPGRHRLRPPPRLPRARRLRQPAGGRGRAGRGARPRVPGDARQRQPRRRPSCSQASATEVKARARRTATRWHVTGRRPQVRAAQADRQGAGRRSGSARGAVIRLSARRQGPLGDRPDAAGRGRVRRGAPRSTAPSSRWSAASTTSATSSTT